ncbi:MAG: hypothetical protein JO146_01910 [Candidatus Eremiobacteraeota bacterium]|nr:hypothetical protein [Candidatus Eremiobacteraeota bacterium]
MIRFKDGAALTVCATLALLWGCSQGSTVPSAPAGDTSQLLQSAAARERIEPVDTTSILKNLNTDVVIGSTVDPSNGDKGPHSLSIVKGNYGLKKGQLVVCNFADSSGTAGNGTTIEVLNPQPSSNPARFAQSNDIKGCSGTATSYANQVYATGLTSGLVVWFDQTGKEQTTYSNLFKAPFSIADIGGGGTYASEFMFNSDAQTGSIVSIGTSGYGSGFYQQVATGFAVGNASQTGWNTVGPSGLAYDHKKDILYIADGVNNTIVRFSNATALLVKNEIVVLPGGTKFKCVHKKTTCGKLVLSGSPLNVPVAMTTLPNGNLIVANTQPASGGGNELVELTPTGQILDTKVVDTGATPAVFGLASSGTKDSNTVLFYTDTNDNSVHELEH